MLGIEINMIKKLIRQIDTGCIIMYVYMFEFVMLLSIIRRSSML